MAGEINEAMGRSYAIPDDVDESDLMAELDALEADLTVEDAGKEGPSYLQVGGWAAGRAAWLGLVMQCSAAQRSQVDVMQAGRGWLMGGG